MNSFRFLTETFLAEAEERNIGSSRAEEMFPGAVEKLSKKLNMKDPDVVKYDIVDGSLITWGLPGNDNDAWVWSSTFKDWDLT